MTRKELSNVAKDITSKISEFRSKSFNNNDWDLAVGMKHIMDYIEEHQIKSGTNEITPELIHYANIIYHFDEIINLKEK